MSQQRRSKNKKRREITARNIARRRLVIIGLVVVLLIAGGVTGALLTKGSDGSEGKQVKLAPESLLTGRVATAPPIVREAYRFAIQNEDILRGVPCYCGCGSVGHIDNYDCFVDHYDENGTLVFSDHALG